MKIDGINKTGEWRFESGIEILDFSGNKFSLLSEDTFSKWNVLNLHSFSLSGNNILNITHFTFFGFQKLQNLDLSGNTISWIECEAFELAVSMAVPCLRSNRITEICPHTFSLLDHLRHLDLSDNMVRIFHSTGNTSQQFCS
jgi:Leucine Rich Repeat.